MSDTLVSKKPWTFKIYSAFIQNTTPELRRQGKKLRHLSFEAISLYNYLSSFASKTSPVPFPSMATIRFDTGWGISTIKKYRRELEQIGLLERGQRKERGRWSSNLYTLNDPAPPSTTFSSVEKQPTEKSSTDFQPSAFETTKKYQCTERGTSAGEDRHEVPDPSSRSTAFGGPAAAAEEPPSAEDGGEAPEPPVSAAKRAESLIQSYREWGTAAQLPVSVVPREREAVTAYFQDNPSMTARELTAIMISAWVMEETVRQGTDHELYWHCRLKSKRLLTFIKHLPEIMDELEWTGTQKRIEKIERIAQEKFLLRKAA